MSSDLKLSNSTFLFNDISSFLVSVLSTSTLTGFNLSKFVSVDASFEVMLLSFA